MNAYTADQLGELFLGVAEIFTEKKDELCDMDAKMGDGDLGLTMHKGYGALPGLLEENLQEGDVGKTLMKSGMKMASLVPSTMGTLMGSGIMEGGKALKGAGTFGAGELTVFLEGFADGIQKRGKCQPGDRTILDAVRPAAERARAAFDGGADMAGVIDAACEGAAAGVEATKDMLPKYGKAAVFSAKAKGVADQGAVAGMYVMEGLRRSIEKA